MSIQSAICIPASNSTVQCRPDGKVKLKGYAVAGGENGPIKEVQLSNDGGETWHAATITYNEGKYSWTIWETWVEVANEDTEILCRAVDQVSVQPASAPPNFRGYVCSTLPDPLLTYEV